jgi:hypothetical protein
MRTRRCRLPALLVVLILTACGASCLSAVPSQRRRRRRHRCRQRPRRPPADHLKRAGGALQRIRRRRPPSTTPPARVTGRRRSRLNSVRARASRPPGWTGFSAPTAYFPSKATVRRRRTLAHPAERAGRCRRSRRGFRGYWLSGPARSTLRPRVAGAFEHGATRPGRRALCGRGRHGGHDGIGIRFAAGPWSRPSRPPGYRDLQRAV